MRNIYSPTKMKELKIKYYNPNKLEQFSKLLKILEIDNEFFFDKIKQQSTKDELKELTNNAFDKEVFGAPTFIVNNKIFWGQDRLEYALEELSDG